jgi:RNA polymerase sigma-70 factor (ECF subfamily)
MDKTQQNQLFEAILKDHRGIFGKVAKTYCFDETDRQDLLQDMLVQVWQALPRYNPDFKLSTWLYRIALNVAISYYRKNAPRTQQQQPLDVANLDLADTSNGENHLQMQLLEQFINELNDLDKALMLLYLEDKSQAEIADILGISTSNVSTKIMRIKEKLKQRFLKHT